jgi:replicative DNA helicase
MSKQNPEQLQQPPCDMISEVSVLGGILNGGVDDASDAFEILDAAEFYSEKHRLIFTAMRRITERSEPCDPVILQAELTNLGTLERIGGLGYIAELIDAVPTAANIRYHARVVADHARLRKLLAACQQTVIAVHERGEASVAEIIDDAERRVFEIAENRQDAQYTSVHDLLGPVFDDIQLRMDTPDGMTGVPTGLKDLDEMTGGFQKGDLVVLAGRPSMGKTALAVGCALHASIEHKVQIAIQSIEMGDTPIVKRFLAYESLVDLGRIMRGRLNDEELVRLAQAAGHLTRIPMFVDRSNPITTMQIRGKLRRLKASTMPELGMVIVDYVQLIRGDGENRTQEVSGISRDLKAIAKEFDVPVIALSQLSRAPEQRSDHRPQLADLRESGSLEQDADLVGLLYRPEKYFDDEKHRGRAELIIAKQRNGPTGTIHLNYISECTRFQDGSAPPRDDETESTGKRNGRRGGRAQRFGGGGQD